MPSAMLTPTTLREAENGVPTMTAIPVIAMASAINLEIVSRSRPLIADRICNPRWIRVEKECEWPDWQIVEGAEREVCNCCLTNSADRHQLQRGSGIEITDEIASQCEREN